MTDHEIISVPTPAGVRAMFTTRHGGMSNGPYASCNLGRGTGDRDNAVRENRRGLCDHLNAGWRGLVEGILANAITAMGTGSPVQAAIGPCAGPCCYEVDDELAARFADEFGPQVVAGRHVDLPQATRHALVQSGVADADIHLDGSCTICTPERFFSYRRDGAATGRQAGLIWRESPA